MMYIQNRSPIVHLMLGFLLVTTTVACAGPIVQILPSTSQVAGIYNYSYVVSDLASASDAVFAITLNDVFGIISASQTAPSDWFATVDPSTNTISWTSLDSTADLKPGATLGGFGFSSTGSPHEVLFIADGSDPLAGIPTGEFDSGQTLGPAAIPEPSTLTLGLIGLVCLVAASSTFNILRIQRAMRLRLAHHESVPPYVSVANRWFGKPTPKRRHRFLNLD
jgi:hypothetical protein